MGAHIVQCAHFFSEECLVPDSLKQQMSGVYEDLLDEGCPSRTLLL